MTQRKKPEGDDEAHKLAKPGPVDEKAKEAEREAGNDLQRAEDEGRSRLGEEDPEIRKP